MAASQMASDGEDRIAMRASLPRLRDEIIDLYLDWREEAAAVADAYALWADAPVGEEGRCFAAYTAALEREEAAARSYADVLAAAQLLAAHGSPGVVQSRAA
jgi:hypothetical protein